MNKKTCFLSILCSFITSIFLCSSAICLSLSTQNKFSVIKDDVVNYVQKTHEPLQFSFYKSKKRIESITSDSILSSLRNDFYNYALATRLFDKSFYLSVEYNNTSFVQDIKLLESSEKPYDGPDYILQGNLDIVYSEATKSGIYTTNFGYLSSEPDSIYISETLAQILLTKLSLSDYREIVYSEQNPSYLSSINIKLKSTLDNAFEYSCKLRGVYKDGSFLASNLDLIGEQNAPLVISSESFFENITFSENKLYCIIKFNNKKNSDTYNHFFNILENTFDDFSMEFDFSCNSNEMVAKTFAEKVNSKMLKSFYSNRWLFYIFSFILTICSLFFSFVFIKKTKVNTIFTITLLIIYFFIIVLVLTNLKGFVWLTRKSLFILIPSLFLNLITVLISNAIKKEQLTVSRNIYCSKITI